MKRVLFVATVVGHINAFHIPYLKWFKEQGWETHVAAHAENEQEQHINYCDIFYEICFTRSPFTFNNMKAYMALKKLINENSFDIIHCHTPVGGALTRLAARDMRGKGHTKVIYTAHGFHFYKGAPLLNWFVYYPIERYLSRYTDVLITINQEDYAIAKNKMHAKHTEYVPGVGIDIEQIKSIKVDRNKKRAELGIPQDAIMLLSVGELSRRKNHEIVIRALAEIKNNNIVYAICGKGTLESYLKKLADNLAVSNRVFLLGFRTDVTEICKAADIFVFPSLQEGLPVALMEAIVCELSVVCAAIRGNKDLIAEGLNGYLFNPKDNVALLEAFNKAFVCNLPNVNSQRKLMIDKFSLKNVLKQMEEIYLDTITKS